MCIIKGIQQPALGENTCNYTEKDNRKALVDEYVAQKRKVANAGVKSSAKQMRANFPNLVNKFILQKWIKDGNEQWIRGKVLKALGNINDYDCKFQVQYIDEAEPLSVKLYEDLRNNDLVIM